MYKIKFVSYSVFGWSDGKLNKSLWNFVSIIFLKALIFERPKNGLVKSKPVKLWKQGRFQIDRFHPQNEKLSHIYIMIVYSIFAIGFPLSEIEVRTNMMRNIDQA